MSNQTVTRAIESDTPPLLIYSRLKDASLLPRWAPVFADHVEPHRENSFQVTKGPDRFIVDVLSNPSSLTVDYLREMSDGKRGGAFIRVMPKPLGGSVVVMTVPVSQAVGSAQVAQVLEEELRTLLTLI